MWLMASSLYHHTSNVPVSQDSELFVTKLSPAIALQRTHYSFMKAKKNTDESTEARQPVSGGRRREFQRGPKLSECLRECHRFASVSLERSLLFARVSFEKNCSQQ
ncbi:hypothetical protein O3P69_019950 [Scylla paramamosain]|uniref:Uncharacterized protein n=1 Tax=Scylla paramamosain TaxID=85552 RepID=A0AAW0SEH6_SCYPA